MAGQGLAQLRAQGVQVTVGVLAEECRALNHVFFHYIQTGRPYVVLKYAMTLDGKLAAYTGASQWITGEAARRHVHTPVSYTHLNPRACTWGSGSGEVGS